MPGCYCISKCQNIVMEWLDLWRSYRNESRSMNGYLSAGLFHITLMKLHRNSMAKCVKIKLGSSTAFRHSNSQSCIQAFHTKLHNKFSFMKHALMLFSVKLVQRIPNKIKIFVFMSFIESINGNLQFAAQR